MEEQAKKREWNRRWRANNKEAVRAMNLRYRHKYKEKIQKDKREYDKVHPKTKEQLDRYSKEMRDKYPEKYNARVELRHAVASKKITKGSCEVCREPKTHGHHEDYSKPLEVIWLCVKHHTERHR